MRNGASAARRDGEPNRGTGLQVDEETEVLLKVTGGHRWIRVLVFHSKLHFMPLSFLFDSRTTTTTTTKKALPKDIFTALT